MYGFKMGFKGNTRDICHEKRREHLAFVSFVNQPYIYQTSDGSWAGVDMDLTDIVQNRLDVKEVSWVHSRNPTAMTAMVK